MILFHKTFFCVILMFFSNFYYVYAIFSSIFFNICITFKQITANKVVRKKTAYRFSLSMSPMTCSMLRYG